MSENTHCTRRPDRDVQKLSRSSANGIGFFFSFYAFSRVTIEKCNREANDESAGSEFSRGSSISDFVDKINNGRRGRLRIRRTINNGLFSSREATRSCEGEMMEAAAAAAAAPARGHRRRLLSRQRYKLADNQLAPTSGVPEQTNDRTRSAARKIFGN